MSQQRRPAMRRPIGRRDWLVVAGSKARWALAVIRIVNGGDNMPAFGSSLKPREIDALVAFLQSRKRPIRPQDQAPIAQK